MRLTGGTVLWGLTLVSSFSAPNIYLFIIIMYKERKKRRLERVKLARGTYVGVGSPLGKISPSYIKRVGRISDNELYHHPA